VESKKAMEVEEDDWTIGTIDPARKICAMDLCIEDRCFVLAWKKDIN
jgi:hypothetical protein